MPVRSFVSAGLFALLTAAAPVAQSAGPEPPPLTLSYADGRVEVARDARLAIATVPDAIDEDDRVLVGDGRAELVADDGTLLHLASGTDLRIDAGMRPRLVRGRVLVHTPPTADGVALALPTGLLRLEPRGVYELRADDLDGDTVIDVIDGRATMRSGDSEWPLGADDQLRLDPRDARPRWSRTSAGDEMRAWSRRRADRATLARAAATLPPATEPWAADLAQAGRWETLPPYGAVWYPAVAPDWRPYSDGTWRLTRRGWTWIDRARWGWPVHHYGRWGWQASRGWYWMPQRAWGPAWVSWVIGADHVGWAPLGVDARPVVPFPLGGRTIDGRWASTWSFAPRHTFGSRVGGRTAFTDPRSLPGAVLGGFVSQPIGPRGPAGPDDRFLARPGEWSAPRSWSAPPPPVPAPRQRPRVVDPPRAWGEGNGMRRPGDAPEARPPDVNLAPVARPRDRRWSTPEPVMSPVDPAPPELQRAPVPVGPPVRPGEGAGGRRTPPPAAAPATAPSGGHALRRPPAPTAETPAPPPATPPARPARRRG